MKLWTKSRSELGTEGSDLPNPAEVVKILRTKSRDIAMKVMTNGNSMQKEEIIEENWMNARNDFVVD